MKRLAVLTLLLLAGVAHAADPMTGVTVQKYRSLTSAAIKAIVTGDDDSSAVLRLFVRWRGDPFFDTGMVMVRRPGFGSGTNAQAGNVYEGRILYLTPGRTADFKVEAIDEDGGSTTTAVDSVSCSIPRPVIATGTVYYVNQSTGSDSYDGLAPVWDGGTTGPKKTLFGAIFPLQLTDVQNGGVIVAPGHYHERLDLDSGTDGYHRFIMGDGTNRDSTIICGANPHGEAGRRDKTNPLVWQSLQDSVYAAYLPDGIGEANCGSCYGDSIGNVVIGWGEYIHRKTSLKAILDDSTAVAGATPNTGELSGWIWQNDTLYIKRRNGRSPAGESLHLGYVDNLIAVKKRNWRISGLTLRYAGAIDNDAGHPANPNPGVNGNAILAGLSATNASGLVVDSCLIYGNNGFAVYARGSGGSRCDSVTVANTIADGLTIGSMAYAAAKGRVEENANSIKVIGAGSNVYRCTVREVHNGIVTGPSADESDSTWALNSEIYGNTITTTSDDAIELDTGHAINQLVMNNVARTTGSGLSVARVYSGPVFAFFNVLWNGGHAGLKIGDNIPAPVLFYHNTVASSRGTSRALEGESGGTVNNLTAYNNIFLGADHATIAGPASAVGSNQFNWNALDSTATFRLIHYNSAYIGFGAWQNVNGQERNGRVGLLRFADMSNGDLRIQAGVSNAYRRGRRITGVNTNASGRLYDVAPHMGALESFGKTCP